jgi:hypothetical protein
MLRNIIESSKVTELYKITADTKRGSLVVKNSTTESADKADAKAVETYILDFDYQPTGVQADMEISAYTDEADTVKAGAVGILVKYAQGGQFGTDQVDGTFAAGDYAIAGTGAKAGLFVKAVTGNVSIYKFVKSYDDAGHTLQRFEIVEPKTV